MHRARFVFLLILALAMPAGTRAVGAALAAQPKDDGGAPLNLHVVAQRDRTVTLGWTPPTTGAEPAAYVVEGGFVPGEVLGSVYVGDAAPTVTFELPTGVYFARVHAVSGLGRSDASNEIRLVVGGMEPPSAPVDLRADVDGSTVSLTWTNTFDGGTPERLLVDAGPNGGSFVVALGESYSREDVPPGVYTATVSAENSAGVSASSNPVTFAVPSACNDVPHAPTSFQARQSGNKIVISWRPPADGPAVSRYRVDVSGAYVGSFETPLLSFTGPGAAGDYAVSVVALNTCGEGPPSPPAPEWTAAVRQDGARIVGWATASAATSYRVYWSKSRADLVRPDATTHYVDVVGGAWTHDGADLSRPAYYRVYRKHGPVVGTGGPIAVAPTFDVTDYANWAYVSASAWDLDGDGCLDVLGAKGRCNGVLEPYPLASVGLEALEADGRANRDSRFADFTGDGITDIFTNVYSRADDPASYAMLHVGDGQGHFVEDPGVSAMRIGGFGETVIAADFDNDGDVDLFVPTYTDRDDGGHNWFLINDGTGHFTDIAADVGLAINDYGPPEGAQAIDVNQDGLVDMLIGSNLLLNNGDLTFTDIAPDSGLPRQFEEGERLVDVDLDGDFDLVRHDPSVTWLYRNEGGTFGPGEPIDGDASTFGYGLNACDINGDGFEDLVIAQNRVEDSLGQPRLLINAGGTFVRSDLSPDATVDYNDLLACVDLDGSGLPDVASRWTATGGAYRTYVTRGATSAPIRLRIVGDHGELNQQGRVVRLRPLMGPDRTLLRVVESGSGYSAQNGYDVVVATPWPGTYEVSVRFAGGWVTTTASPGETLTIAANGAVVRQPR